MADDWSPRPQIFPVEWLPHDQEIARQEAKETAPSPYTVAHAKWLRLRGEYEVAQRVADHAQYVMNMAYCDCIEADMPELAMKLRKKLKEQNDAFKEREISHKD